MVKEDFPQDDNAKIRIGASEMFVYGALWR